MIRLAWFACVVGAVPQGIRHGARAAIACDITEELDYEPGSAEETYFEDSSSLLQASLSGAQDSSSSLLAAVERPEWASAPAAREHVLLQTAAAVGRAASAAAPAVNLAELGAQLGSSDSDAIIAVLLMVGLPLALGIACLFLVPRDGLREDNATSLLKGAASMPATAETMSPGPGSRAPTRRLSNISSAPVGNDPTSTSGDQPAVSTRIFNLPRSDSLSSNASLPETIHKTICETGTLCQSLVVPKATGVTLGVEGDLLPCQQETVCDITMKDSTNNEGLLRLLVSETGKDRGMLLESVLKLPIAIIDTNAAVAPAGASPPSGESRHVLIRRDMDPTRAPFAVVRAEPGAQRVFKATRGTLGGGEGEHLLSVLIDKGGLRGNIVSAEGKLVASMETRTEPGGRTERFLNICQGADSALVLCVVFASVKLG